MTYRIKTAIFILSVGTLAMAQPIKKNGDCTGLTPRLNATSGENWGQFPIKPPTAQFAANTYQPPLTPQQSINCVETPPDLVPEIIATEEIAGCTPGLHYLMYFTFDERGRVWAVDARDYPNNINSNRTTGGQGRILILEDTDGDGALNSCKEFYKGLVIPTSVEVVKGGVVVSVHPNVYFIPSTNDVGGTPQLLYSGNTTQNYDTHGGINSLMYSIDNWVYGHTGAQFNGGNAFTVDGANASAGKTWRFRNTAIGNGASSFQVFASGPANAHGTGQMENGNIFQSQATVGVRSNHSIRRGVSAVGLVNGNNFFYPITSDLYLWEGSSTAICRMRSAMMLRWISSVPPAIEVAGTETRISAITPSSVPSLPVSSALAPSIIVCTRAAARATWLPSSLPSEPSGPCGRPSCWAARARMAVHSADFDSTSTFASSCRTIGSLILPVAFARSSSRSTRPARCGYHL